MKLGYTKEDIRKIKKIQAKVRGYLARQEVKFKRMCMKGKKK